MRKNIHLISGTGSSHWIWKLRAWERIIAIQYGGRGWKRPAVVFNISVRQNGIYLSKWCGRRNCRGACWSYQSFIVVILEQERWGAGLTCSCFCGRVIIYYNYQIAITPISPETAAKNCFAPGNEEKETPGGPRFDIISRWNIGRIAWTGIPVQSVESADCRPGKKAD